MSESEPDSASLEALRSAAEWKRALIEKREAEKARTFQHLRELQADIGRLDLDLSDLRKSIRAMETERASATDSASRNRQIWRDAGRRLGLADNQD